MKLYRHHSVSFQKQIESANGFIVDNSREFNHDKKNVAEFFFYADTVESAEGYANANTQLFTYTTAAKVLDLTTAQGRAMCVNAIAAMVAQDNATKSNMVKNVPAKFLPASAKVATTFADVINDNPVSGVSFWNQNCVDYNIGVELKKDIIALGFDGVIFADGVNKEVALLNAAKQI